MLFDLKSTLFSEVFAYFVWLQDNAFECKLFSLPTRFGGLGILDSTKLH